MSTVNFNAKLATYFVNYKYSGSKKSVELRGFNKQRGEEKWPKFCLTMRLFGKSQNFTPEYIEKQKDRDNHYLLPRDSDVPQVLRCITDDVCKT